MAGIIVSAGNSVVNKMGKEIEMHIYVYAYMHIHIHIATHSQIQLHTQTCTQTASLQYSIVINSTDSEVKLPGFQVLPCS